VMFYAMLQLRAELRERGAFAEADEPNLAALLDLVALGTVADVVRLDDNNRVLVQQGLNRIRAGRSRPGIQALLELAGRDAARANAYELGFVIGPRLNAAGRLTDMSTGIECLLAEDSVRAGALARELDTLNRERRGIEAQMQDTALAHLQDLDPGDAWGVSLYDPTWHQGVIGILAALARRERTGLGGHVDTALVDSTVGVLANQALNYFVSKEVPARIGNAHPNIVPYQVFEVADGHLILAVGNDGQFRRLAEVLGDVALAEDPRFATNTARVWRNSSSIASLPAPETD